MTQAKAQVAECFNLDELDSQDGPITHHVSLVEDEDGNSISGLVMVGKNSDQYQEVTREQRIRNIKRAAKRNKQIDTSTNEGAEIVALTVEENDRAVALAVVTGWYGMTSNGELKKFDKAIVAKMFEKRPQVQAKVLAALEVESNFTKASSKA